MRGIVGKIQRTAAKGEERKADDKCIIDFLTKAPRVVLRTPRIMRVGLTLSPYAPNFDYAPHIQHPAGRVATHLI